MNTLDQLTTDHAYLRDTLALLKSQLATDAAFDPQRLRDILSRFSAYFVYVHRPREDRVFEYMLRGDVVPQPVVRQALAEHEDLAHYAVLFRSLLDEVMPGNIMLREDLTHIGWQFLAANQENMALEEASIFVKARAMLTDEDWMAINSAHRNYGYTG